MSKRNRYSKALKLLKSTQIEEKLKRLDEALPTNHTTGLYSLNAPGFRVGPQDPAKTFYPDADGEWPSGIPGTEGELTYERPRGYWSGERDWDTLIVSDFSQDYLKTDPTGKSTAGLIADDGTVLAGLPPGGESFILGPLTDGWVLNHTTDAYTNIGYLQKDTRQFVLLGKITGQWKADLNSDNPSVPIWDGTSTGFTSYNENFTLAMAQWVRQKILDGKYAPDVPYFYSGGVPQEPQSAADCPLCPSGMYGGLGIDPSNFGEGGDPTIGTEQIPPKSGDAKDAGFPWEWFNKKKKDTYDPDKKYEVGDKVIKDGEVRYFDGFGWSDTPPNEYDPDKKYKVGDKVTKDGEVRYFDGFGWSDKPPGDTETKEPKTKEDTIDWEYINRLQQKAPWEYTDAEKRALDAAGQSDFYKGGQTSSPLGDLALLGATAGLVKGALSAGLTGLGLAMKSFGTASLGSQLSSFTGDAKNAGDYNKQLATKLTTSIISGKPQEIKLSNKGAKDQIDNLNPEAVSEFITIGGKAHKPSAETTVNPKEGTKGPLFGDSGWGTQGASEIHYDPKTDTLTITSEKTLRTGQEGDKFDITKGGKLSGDQVVDRGKQTEFGDIPSPSPEKVEKIVSDLLKNVAVDHYYGGVSNLAQFFNTTSHTGTLGPISSNVADMTSGVGSQSQVPTWDQIKNNPQELEKFEKNVASAANDIGTGAIQGTASNTVALRNALTDLGVPQSEVEEIGGGYGQVYSQTNYSGDQIPASVRAVINSKTKKESFSFGRLKKVKFVTETASDAPTSTMMATSYKPQNRLFTESSFTPRQRKILREIKKPIEIKEAPKKYKMNFAGKYSSQNTPDKTASAITDELVASGNARGQRWRRKDKYWQGYETTERMNIIYDRVGHGSQAWERTIAEAQRKNGWRTREMQEQLNIRAHEKAMLKENPDYQSPWGIEIVETTAENEKRFDKVNKIKQVVSQNKKKRDIAPEYPKDPPPEMINGWHPDLANGQQIANRYNKLDPQSAEAMPKTGNPHIDAKVEKAKNKPK